MISNWPERIVQVFRDHPPGAVLPSPFIARRASLPQGAITRRLDLMAEHSIVVCEARQAKPARWVLTSQEPEAAIARMRMTSRRARGERKIPSERSRALSITQARVIARMRAMMLVGPAVVDPSPDVAEAMEAARVLLAAKLQAGCRFTGAEVDLLIARELRQVSEAAQRAAESLRQALEAMRA